MDRASAIKNFRTIYHYMADHISEILSDYDPVDWTKRFDFHDIKKVRIGSHGKRKPYYG